LTVPRESLRVLVRELRWRLSARSQEQQEGAEALRLRHRTLLAVLWETRKRAWKRLGATFGHGVERPRDGHPPPAPKQARDANSLDVSELARFPSAWARG